MGDFFVNRRKHLSGIIRTSVPDAVLHMGLWTRFTPTCDTDVTLKSSLHMEESLTKEDVMSLEVARLRRRIVDTYRFLRMRCDFPCVNLSKCRSHFVSFPTSIKTLRSSGAVLKKTL